MNKSMNRELGRVSSMISQGRYEDAAAILEKILKEEAEPPELLGLLGAIRMEQGNFDEAVALFGRVLEHMPGHVPTLYNLARTLHLAGRKEEAKRLYEELIEISPTFFHAWNNLGLILSEMGRLNEAEKVLKRAVEIAPDHAPSANNLAVVLEGLGRFHEARRMFERAIRLEKGYFSARFNLGCLLFRIGRYDEAERELKWVLSVKDDEPTARFLLQSMGRMDMPERAPTQYVRRTFDHWAVQFEEKLVDELGYETPEKLFDFLREFLFEKMDIMDLGCGTGLGADLYRPFASWFAGMDCSRKMLEKAKAKDVYDKLYLHDIVEPWPTDRKFHLIYSSDCLCYFGNLGPVFKRVRENLMPGAVFGFSVERQLESDGSEEGYILGKSGRYRHSAEYVTRMLEKTGLKPVKQQTVTLRKEAGKPVEGLLFAAKMPKD